MLRTTSGNQLTEEELVALEAKFSFWAEQYLDKEKEAGISTSFTNPIPKTPVSELEDITRMANFLRQERHCGDGPCHVYCDCWSERHQNLTYTPERFILKKVTVCLFREASIPAQLKKVYTIRDDHE